MKNLQLTIDAQALTVETLQQRSRTAMLHWLAATDREGSDFWYATMEGYARQARMLANPVTLAVTGR